MAFTLVVNLLRGLPLVNVAASLVVAGIFYWMWVGAGKPQGLHGGAAAGPSPGVRGGRS
ncbi:UNVERIFIED_ORG: hypothetical protein J2X79_004660 [Arthrobacter globiformis]|nr:hypothetical protein [Arthrobacter globiformis]